MGTGGNYFTPSSLWIDNWSLTKRKNQVRKRLFLVSEQTNKRKSLNLKKKTKLRSTDLQGKITAETSRSHLSVRVINYFPLCSNFPPKMKIGAQVRKGGTHVSGASSDAPAAANHIGIRMCGICLTPGQRVKKRKAEYHASQMKTGKIKMKEATDSLELNVNPPSNVCIIICIWRAFPFKCVSILWFSESSRVMQREWWPWFWLDSAICQRSPKFQKCFGGNLLMEFQFILYQSIALEVLYNFVFDYKMMRLSIRPQIKVKVSPVRIFAQVTTITFIWILRSIT